MNCTAPKADGSPCESVMAGPDGLCPAHRDPERMKDISAMGGAANKAKHFSPGFTDADVPHVTTVDEAKAAQALIAASILTGRITDRVGTAASKALAEWIKAHTAGQTQQVVDKVTAELERVKAECETLRKQIADKNPLRIAK